VFEVSLPPTPHDQLAVAIDGARYRALQDLAERARDGLGGSTLWNVSSTATGGGVAEMLRSLVGLAVDAGFDVRWLVVRGTPEVFAVTKRIHNGLHGSAGDGGDLGEEERSTYARVTAHEAEALGELLRPGDVVVLHDPQTAGLAEIVRARGAVAIWRCHVGTEVRDRWTERAWSFLRSAVEAAPVSVFSRAAYIPEWLDGRDRTVVIPPAIDPSATKNIELDALWVPDILVAAGLLEGTPVTDGGVRHRATVVSEGGPLAHHVPLVVQVSRWDRLKDMPGVIDAFVRGVVDGPDESGAYLVLAGPSVVGVTDDPEGVRSLAETTETWRALPDHARRRVVLASLDVSDVDENALVVNALQRHAAVVTQKSLREGFGLTVTEAMWKARPVVASAVGGIQDQIEDHLSGRLVDPVDGPAFAAALRELLGDPATAARLGAAARERVREHFLPDRQLTQWLELVLRLRATTVTGGRA
jgi:trehalose synthase